MLGLGERISILVEFFGLASCLVDGRWLGYLLLVGCYQYVNLTSQAGGLRLTRYGTQTSVPPQQTSSTNSCRFLPSRLQEQNVIVK